MVTETLTTAQASVSNPRSYFIVFNKDTAKILRISTTKASTYDRNCIQFETKNQICKAITKGTASLKKHAVVWDVINDKWDIDTRSTTLIIESKHNKLIPFIKDMDPTTSEIFVKVFYDKHYVVVEANRKNIASIKNLSDITEISTTETKLLDIYITRKNDPDYLINTISIDPLTLFREGSQEIKFKDRLNKRADWQNISLYAKSVFIKYGWSLLSSDNVQTTKSNRLLQQSNVVDKNNININVVDNVMHIKSKIEESELYYFRGKKKLQIVVCSETIDNFVGAFEISVDQLLQGTSKLNINFDWPETPLLIYKNNYLAISTGEIK